MVIECSPSARKVPDSKHSLRSRLFENLFLFTQQGMGTLFSSELEKVKVASHLSYTDAKKLTR